MLFLGSRISQFSIPSQSRPDPFRQMQHARAPGEESEEQPYLYLSPVRQFIVRERSDRSDVVGHCCDGSMDHFRVAV